MSIRLSRWKTLSPGLRGPLYSVRKTTTGEDGSKTRIRIAAKELINFDQAVLMEIKLLRHITELSRIHKQSHLFSILIHPSMKTDTSTILFMELAKCDLFQEIDRRWTFDIDTIISRATQIAQAINFLHNYGILHRDVSAENILLRHDGSVCITDFGMSVFVRQDSNQRYDYRTSCVFGKTTYLSPQRYSNPYLFDGQLDDIWAFGVVLFMLSTGKLPFSASFHNGHSECPWFRSMYNKPDGLWNIVQETTYFSYLRKHKPLVTLISGIFCGKQTRLLLKDIIKCLDEIKS